jgi:hypothetical protein
LIIGLIAGKYKNGTLTLFDNIHTNGIAWSLINVTAKVWNVCPVAP